MYKVNYYEYHLTRCQTLGDVLSMLKNMTRTESVIWCDSIKDDILGYYTGTELARQIRTAFLAGSVENCITRFGFRAKIGELLVMNNYGFAIPDAFMLHRIKDNGRIVYHKRTDIPDSLIVKL